MFSHEALSCATEYDQGLLLVCCVTLNRLPKPFDVASCVVVSIFRRLEGHLRASTDEHGPFPSSSRSRNRFNLVQSRVAVPRHTAVAYSPSWLMLIRASYSSLAPLMIAAGAPCLSACVEVWRDIVISCQVRFPCGWALMTASLAANLGAIRIHF